MRIKNSKKISHLAARKTAHSPRARAKSARLDKMSRVATAAGKSTLNAAEKRPAKTTSKARAPRLVRTDAENPESRSQGDSRTALLKAASRVFAKNGFDGTTVKQLADQAGVNISMVSYYFGGKAGLYKTMLETFGLEGVASSERLLKLPRSREEFELRLGLFAESIFAMTAKEPELVRIIHRSMDMPSPLTDQIFENVFSRIFSALQTYIQRSCELGIIRQDIDPGIVSEFIFGSLIHYTHCEEIRVRRGGQSIQNPQFVDHVVKTWLIMLTDGLITPSSKAQESTT